MTPKAPWIRRCFENSVYGEVANPQLSVPRKAKINDIFISTVLLSPVYSLNPKERVLTNLTLTLLTDAPEFSASLSYSFAALMANVLLLKSAHTSSLTSVFPLTTNVLFHPFRKRAPRRQRASHIYLTNLGADLTSPLLRYFSREQKKIENKHIYIIHR